MMKKLILTALIGLFSLTGNCQLFGDWHSSFIVMGMSTRLSMNIAEDSVIRLSSPDEEFPSAKMKRIEIKNDSVKFQWSALNLKFAGKYKKDDELIVGEMSQAGMTWETVFTRELQEKLVSGIENRRCELLKKMRAAGPFKPPLHSDSGLSE